MATSVGPVNVMLTADPTGIAKGVDQGTKELRKIGGPVKIQDVDIDQRALDRVDKRLTRKIQKAAVLGTDPEIVRQVQLSALERVQTRTLRVAEAKERFGSLAGLSAQIGNVAEESRDWLAAMAPLAGAVGLVTGAVYGMIKLGEMADPYRADQFNRAWADLMAVIGSNFIPVLDLATKGVRLLADSMMEGGFFNPGGAKVRNTFRRLGILGGDLEATSAAFEPNESSVGKGDFNWRPKFMEISQLGEQAYLAAFQQSTVGDKVDKTNEILQEIKKDQEVQQAIVTSHAANQWAMGGGSPIGIFGAAITLARGLG